VDYLTVAYADEGVELRREGIHAPIMVLNPQEAGFDAMLRYQLEPEIYSMRLLQAYAIFSQHRTGDFAIHLKLDTGMHRLGFVASELPVLIEILQQNPQIRIKSIFTHLAASEAPEHDDFTLEQLHLYKKMYERIAEAIGYQPLQHALNTAGVHRFPEWQMDMVRLGIGLYGLDNYADFKESLFTVLTLRATISQIHTLQPGETVGYGRRWRAERVSRIGTISIGYADGLRRAAGNGNFSVWLHDKLAPIVGTVAMDMCMVDLTDIPEAREDDEVEIFGENQSVRVLAKALNAIPLEIFATIAERVKRVYVQE
jgi:alanine racemase